MQSPALCWVGLVVYLGSLAAAFAVVNAPRVPAWRARNRAKGLQTLGAITVSSAGTPAARKGETYATGGGRSGRVS